jgi:hypothetical protein
MKPLSAKFWMCVAASTAVAGMHYSGSIMLDNWWRANVMIPVNHQSAITFTDYYDLPCDKLSSRWNRYLGGGNFDLLNAFAWGLSVSPPLYAILSAVESIFPKKQRALERGFDISQRTNGT